MTEGDGEGLIAEPFRQAIIESEGYWVLDVRPSNRIKTLKVLNVVLKVSIADLAEMHERLPGNVLGGTRAEMEWLRSHLAGYDIHSTVEQTDRRSVPANMDLAQIPSEVLSGG